MKNKKSFIGALDAANIPYKTDLTLAEHSTFRIGGRADLALVPRSCEEMIAAIKLSRDSGEKYAVIGNGSNILFSDAGYDGIMILTDKFNRFSVKDNRICGVFQASFHNTVAGSGVSLGVQVHQKHFFAF